MIIEPKRQYRNKNTQGIYTIIDIVTILSIDYAVERAKKSPNAELRRKRSVKSPGPKAEEDTGQ